MEFTQEERDQVYAQFDIMKSKATKSRKQKDIEQINEAFEFAYKAHYPVRRKSGEPYILHPIAVAEIVASEIMLGTTSIITALLHDVVEDTDYSTDDIAQFFGTKVANMVEGLTKMSGVFDHRSSLQAENFRKMLLSMSDDVRVILIKLADRLHNMRTLESMPANTQLKIAGETLFLYAPLAHRLGLYQIKTELEDISFRYRHPEDYQRINHKLEESVKKRTNFINKFSFPITVKMDDAEFDFDVSGRPKSVYSIWQKMQKKGVTFEQIYDLFAIRIIFTPQEGKGDEKEQCYKVYAMITDIYQPRPDRLRDWVNTPKANGYEALHSTVMGPNGKWVEVQIRTRRMNEIAERGFAAHWKYKGHHDQESELDRWLKKIRETIETPDANALEFLDNVKLNLYTNEIMVFTPKGKLINFPQGALALDFAYEIHTEIGNEALYAEINHKSMPLTTKLNSGDQVRIITSAKAKPKIEWMGMLATVKAKNAIRAYFNKEKHAIIEEGKKIYLDLIHSQNFKINERFLMRLRDQLDVKSKQDIFYGFGNGSITVNDLKKVLKSRTAPKWIRFWSVKSDDKLTVENKNIVFDKKKTINISDKDITKQYQISQCCNPLPGDAVIGYFAPDKNIIFIHKSTCPEAVKLSSGFGDRIVKVKWTSHKAIAFLSNIRLEGIDQPGIVHSVTNIISKELRINIRTIHFETHDNIFNGWVELYVYNKDDMKHLIQNLKNIKGMSNVWREHNSSK